MQSLPNATFFKDFLLTKTRKFKKKLKTDVKKFKQKKRRKCKKKRCRRRKRNKKNKSRKVKKRKFRFRMGTRATHFDKELGKNQETVIKTDQTMSENKDVTIISDSGWKAINL